MIRVRSGEADWNFQNKGTKVLGEFVGKVFEFAIIENEAVFKEFHELCYYGHRCVFFFGKFSEVL